MLFSLRTFVFLMFFFFFPVQFSSFAQSCPTLCNPVNHSMPGLPVLHQLPEFIQTHVNRVSDAIQLSHPLSFPSPPASNPSQHQGLFQRVNSSHEVAKYVIRKDAWNDFNFFEFTKARFMAQDVIYPGECSMCTWEKGEINCFGVKCPIDIN